jgi:hypothetical protein
VFTSHGLGIRAPVEVLRTKVLRGLPPLDESHPLVILLIRLNVLDVRYAYARWGHATFIRCAWCRAPAEFALAALPSVLAPYVTEAVILGALGWVNVPGSVERKRLFRPAAGWAIAAMLIAEIAARWAVEIRAPPGGDCLHVSWTRDRLRTV